MTEPAPHVCEVSHIPVAPCKSLVALILSRAAGGEVALWLCVVQAYKYWGTLLRHFKTLYLLGLE